MKLLRLKVDEPFRSLQAGFECYFRTPWEVQEEQGIAPFVCAGRNGSGKSNLLEVIAVIFFNVETRYLDYLPEGENSKGESTMLLTSDNAHPDAYELEYQIPVETYGSPSELKTAHVLITKSQGYSPVVAWLNYADFGLDERQSKSRQEVVRLLPTFILGYSSGENEILSLPFFKMRFVQFDEYWNALKAQLNYPGRPETRMTFIDSAFSQAVMLCNLLFQDEETLKPFRDDVGVKDLTEFRIIIKRSIEIDAKHIFEFQRKGEPSFENAYEMAKHHPALNVVDSGEGVEKSFRVNLIKLLEADAESSKNFDPIVTRLKRCATCSFMDEATDTLYLDYYVNEATKQAFKENFDQSPIALFQAFQVLLTLNLYSVSDPLKSDLYQSESLYVSETIPVLASDERIMRFKHFWIEKIDVDRPVLLKSLSDGEHQLLHSLGLCLLFRNTNSLFLLDEPETHFNPDWRSNFIARLRQCFQDSENSQEMLITTHSPFLISDCKPEQVLVFDKQDKTVSVQHPDYNTLGASINKITLNTFNKRETIGGYAQQQMEAFKQRFEAAKDQASTDEKRALIDEINHRLGDSVEKILLIKTILDSMESTQGDNA